MKKLLAAIAALLVAWFVVEVALVSCGGRSGPRRAIAILQRR
ncbi:MAG TPA: hypothetical protein VMU58_11250 [Gaiellaceae bacterium]|nr:hypothetical protein [Gaiellaceae bacterium]